MASPFKDIARVANGLSLVVKEGINRSQPADLGNLIKAALLSATDVTGLTKGKLRTLQIDTTDAPRNKGSVVYFTDDISTAESAALQTPDDISTAPPQTPDDISAAAPQTPDDISTAAPQTPDSNTGILVVPSSNASVDAMDASTTVVADGVTTRRKKRKPRERRVPSTPFSRAIGFAGLGADLAWGTVQESAKRILFGTSNSESNQHALSPYLSDRNAERLALALCRMRGAALKLGQMLSIQDESLVPAPILKALDIVRQGADTMPRNQLNEVLDAELGSNWSSKLMSFDYEPMAAASIGQVMKLT